MHPMQGELARVQELHYRELHIQIERTLAGFKVVSARGQKATWTGRMQVEYLHDLGGGGRLGGSCGGTDSKVMEPLPNS